MVVGDFPIETDTIVIGAGLADMLRLFGLRSLAKK